MSEPIRHEHPLLRSAEMAADPIEQFAAWFEQAERDVPLAEAMTIATVDPGGMPDARMVLLRGFGPQGFRFFTNYESAKGRQIAADPRAALVVYWREQDRQVRARGDLEPLPAAESDAYFLTRPRESRLGAWASPQSRPLGGREELDRSLEEVRGRWAEDEEIPRPEHWGGYLLRPSAIEFWQGQQARLHDRFLYTRRDEGGWRIQRLAP